MIKYKYAKDSAGDTIDIDCVSRDNKDKCYYCIGCGSEMSPVLGDVNTHHFRHKDEHCSRESYLHKLGKVLLKKRFETFGQFIIQCYLEWRCDKEKDCRLRKINGKPKCNEKKMVRFDLKKYYDTCEEEVTYKGFRADLMLSNSKDSNIPPIFLEISVTHDCEKEKIESGIRIIELKINDEKDIEQPLVEKSTNDIELSSVRFYNFINERCFPLVRFAVRRDENGILSPYCRIDGLNCRNVENNHLTDSIYEVAMLKDIYYGKKLLDYNVIGHVKAITNGLPLKHCELCPKCYMNCVLDECDNNGNLIRRYPTKRILGNNKINKYVIANKCTKFDWSYIIFEIKRTQNFPCWEWSREKG